MSAYNSVSSFAFVPPHDAVYFYSHDNSFSSIAEEQLQIARHLIGSYNSSYFGLNANAITQTLANLNEDTKTYRLMIARTREALQNPQKDSQNEEPASKGIHCIRISTVNLPPNPTAEDVEAALKQFESCVDALEKTIPQFQQMRSPWCQIL